MKDRMTLNELIRSKGLFAELQKSRIAGGRMALALFDEEACGADYWMRSCASEALYTFILQHAPRHSIVCMDEWGRTGVIFAWEELGSIVQLQRLAMSSDYVRRIRIGVGSPVYQSAQLPQCYEQSCFAIQHQFYLSSAQPVFYDTIPSYIHHIEYPAEQEEELLHVLLDDRGVAAIELAVEHYFEALLSRGFLPEKRVKDAVLQLLASLQLRLRLSRGQHPSAAVYDMTTLMLLQTLQEVKSWTAGAIKQMGREADHSESVNRTLIKKAVHLMEGDYSIASLHYIAEKMYITPTYLSILFKSNMGVTFIEHLTSIRISNAKRLLKQTQLKNYEVAERVGYHDSRYFSQIFKKKVGLSPSEYRDAN